METVDKKWGKELVIHNDSEYCGKVLFFNAGAKFSMHFHSKKKETWYISKGTLIFRYIDTTDASIRQCVLQSGESVEIDRNVPHQLEAIEESEVFEVSTQHFDDDSFRVGKGDSQC